MSADPFKPLLAADGSFLPQPKKVTTTQVDPAEMRQKVAEIGAHMDSWKTGKAAKQKSTALVRSYAAIEETKVVTVFPELLWEGKRTDIGGNPGLGKSTLWAEIAARLTRGGKVSPYSDQEFEPINVLIATSEDGAEDTCKPRLRVAGADMSRVFDLEGIANADGSVAHLDIGKHLLALDEAIGTHKAKLFVADPISSFLGLIDTHQQSQVRGVVDPLKGILEKHKCAMLGIQHLNKTTGTQAIYRFGGSISMIGAPRAAFAFVRDESQGSKSDRLLLPVKVNLIEEPQGFALRITSCEGQPKIEWSPARTDIRVDEVLAAKAPSQADRAFALLRDVMSPGQRVPAKAVEQMCRERGIGRDSWREAIKRLGAKAERDGKAGTWHYVMPAVQLGDESQWIEDAPRAEEVAGEVRAPLTQAAENLKREWLRSD